MSVFDGTTPQDQPLETTSVVDQLVGEGKKFKTIEDALNGKIESDNYITELKSKLSALEAEALKGNRIEELLSQLQAKATTPVVTPAPTQVPVTDSKPQLDVSDLKSLVDSAMSEREKDLVKTKNIQIVEQELVKNFGTEAKAKVTSKARELGMSEDKLKAMAEDSPAAFLTLMGQPLPKPNGSLPVSSVNTNALISSGKRNNAFYSALRRENPSSFYSPKTQTLMMNDRVELGNDFYNK